MTLKADLYFSFRSPYSYLAVGRYRDLVREHDLEISLRTVLPIAVRDPDILFAGNPAAPRYIVMDCMRAAQFLDIPISWPRPDPIVQDLATRKIAEEQPYIFRICRLGQAATRRGKGLEFAAEVAPIIWRVLQTALGWILTSLKLRQPLMLTRSMPKLKATPKPWKKQATGAFRRSSSMVSPSLVRTAWTWPNGASSKRGSQSGENGQFCEL